MENGKIQIADLLNTRAKYNNFSMIKSKET